MTNADVGKPSLHGREDHSGSCCSHTHSDQRVPSDGQPLDPWHAPSSPADGATATKILSASGLRIERNGRILIDDVTLAIEPGEIVTLIGPNGAGKSTLVKALLGLLPLNSGSVSKAPGLTIGYVPQRFDIDPAIPLTVIGFLSLGTGTGTFEITGALGQVGVPHLIRAQIARLSGGELQRVLLARALLRKPRLLVLDEPGRGLDHLGEAEMYEIIANVRAASGAAVLLVSHDLHLVMAKTDRVICINRHVCCSGRPQAVAAHPAYTELFGAEAARAFAVYTHHHDHAHDMTGAAVQAPPPTDGRT